MIFFYQPELITPSGTALPSPCCDGENHPDVIPVIGAGDRYRKLPRASRNRIMFKWRPEDN